jgi:SAM-dependent methyltransferase
LSCCGEFKSLSLTKEAFLFQKKIEGIFMTVKEHYDNHLAAFYSWMAGDFNSSCADALSFLKENQIYPNKNESAVDLGAGHGIFSIALAKLGYKVVAVDFNKQLLDELTESKGTLNIQIIESDIFEYSKDMKNIELCLCMGDTLAHLDSIEMIKKFLKNIYSSLEESGNLILSFRDYSIPLEGNNRFIPVKSDENRILTCFLEYDDYFVTVNDLLYEQVNGKWIQKISSYKKTRINKNQILKFLGELGFLVIFETVNRGMIYLILER